MWVSVTNYMSHVFTSSVRALPFGLHRSWPTGTPDSPREHYRHDSWTNKPCAGLHFVHIRPDCGPCPWLQDCDLVAVSVRKRADGRSAHASPGCSVPTTRTPLTHHTVTRAQQLLRSGRRTVRRPGAVKHPATARSAVPRGAIMERQAHPPVSPGRIGQPGYVVPCSNCDQSPPAMRAAQSSRQPPHPRLPPRNPPSAQIPGPALPRHRNRPVPLRLPRIFTSSRRPHTRSMTQARTHAGAVECSARLSRGHARAAPTKTKHLRIGRANPLL